MSGFDKAYNALNKNQREAVDAIDGPVLVVAGPGTGKTQLLGMRAANIVRLTDTLPSNILCLTFTESAASAMRQRLITLMGPEGNKVAVHTFHSFGTEIINTYPEFFYNGAAFSPADELTSYEILHDIFAHLPHSSPLAKTMNGQFTALPDAQRAISHLKRGGLLPGELLDILDHNQKFCDAAQPLLAPLFDARLSKQDIPKVEHIIPQLNSLDGASPKNNEEGKLYTFRPLQEICTAELQRAVAEAHALGKTTPLTAWRNRWFERNSLGELIFKDRALIKKLRALAHIYQKYRQTLQENSLFDFDDMVSTVAHTLETTPELRLNLQERYLYVMVDEFQDTNQAQARLLDSLTNNPVHEGRPNILAVGDDDQAIYTFQGAEISNILAFKDRYKHTKIVTLTDNYRSTKTILSHARHVITQGADRLEGSLQEVHKDLTAHNAKADTTASLHLLPTADDELRWVASHIKTRIQEGTPAKDIAVLARHHKQLISLLPHLRQADIPVIYERRDNALEDPRVTQLITMAETIVALAEQRYDVAESLLPELLSYPFWRIKTQDLWQLSTTAYREHRMWIELMIDARSGMRHIAEFLLMSAHYALHEPLDLMLDRLLGTNESQVPNEDIDNGAAATMRPEDEEETSSPFRDYYFNEQQLRKNPASYLSLLDNLRAIRRALGLYRRDTVLRLRDFIDFVELCERTGTAITSTTTLRQPGGVQLMTAHKAKGLEFDTVFVLSCQDGVWGRKARRPGSSLRFPHNLPLEPAGQHYDEALRLFFVAMTRAKHHLVLTAHSQDESGKEKILAEFLQNSPLKPIPSTANAPAPQELTPGWELRHISMPKAKQQELLAPVLENYQLSATHLNNFTDITRGGPQAFFLQNLLRFPQAVSTGQVFGRAIHAVLARAHIHLSASGERRPIEDILHDFELQLQNARLDEHDFAHLLEKGGHALHTYLGAHYNSFHPTQKAERSFGTQAVYLDNVHLTGVIDLIDADPLHKTLVITDYKTGKCYTSWRAKTDYDRIRLHKFRQQLMFYKLLAEHSRDFAGYTVEKGVLAFVEPDEHKQCQRLEMTFDADELAGFTKLIAAIWKHITSLDLPDTSKYPLTYQGILAFEKDLMAE